MKFLLISSENDSDNNLRTWDLILSILFYNINWKYGNRHRNKDFYFKHVITQIVFIVLLWLMKYSCNEEYLLWNGQVFSTYVCVMTEDLFKGQLFEVSIWGLPGFILLYFCISLWLCNWTTARTSPDAHYHYQGTLHPS